MKYLKTYEDKFSEEDYNNYFEYENDIENCGYYIASKLPKEKFFDWQFENDIDEIIENDFVQFEFFYDEDINEDELDRILQVFDKEDIYYYIEEGLHTLAGKDIKKQTKIVTHINKDKINFYTTVTKYNL